MFMVSRPMPLFPFTCDLNFASLDGHFTLPLWMATSLCLIMLLILLPFLLIKLIHLHLPYFLDFNQTSYLDLQTLVQ